MSRIKSSKQNFAPFFIAQLSLFSVIYCFSFNIKRNFYRFKILM